MGAGPIQSYDPVSRLRPAGGAETPRTMADVVDPETLLEWLQMGSGDERDMQLIALEQLCMLLLMSDNVDRCFEM